MGIFSADTKVSNKSETQNVSTQQTVNPTVSGVAGDIYSGQEVNISGLAGADLSAAISGLINLTQSGLETAQIASLAAVSSSEKSAQNVTLPGASILDKALPFAIVAIIGLVLWKAF